MALTVHAQVKPEVHKINGQKYYLHVVEKGNTLYAISKLYQTTIDAIEQHNPVIKEDGLKVNQTLLIPVNKDNKRDLGGLVEQSSNSVSHEVQPKETLYAISKQYDVPLNALLKANPEVEKEGLKIGMLIQVPIEKVEVEQENHIEPAQPDSLERHIVQPKETLYGLSKQYNTTVDALKAANDGLPIGLKVGMALRIPGTRVEMRASDRKKPIVRKRDTMDSVVTFIPDSGTALSIALLLPLSPSLPDSGGIDDFKISEIQRIGLSFYRGFMYALDSLSEAQQLQLDVRVMDGGQDTAFMGQIIRSGQLDSAEVVIGPFFTDQFEQVADHLLAKGVPVICPVPKPSKILFKRPNAIKTTPSERMQLDAIAQYLAKHYRDSNVVVVNSNKFQDQDNIEFFKTRMGEALGIPDTFVNDVIREIKLWDINDETLNLRFKDSASYTLVVPSSNKVFVTKLLNGLYDFQYESEGKFKFRLIGLEDWLKFESDFEVKFLHALDVTIPITNHIDFQDYRINAFFKHYRNKMGFEPNRFTLMGYDVASYVITQAEHQKMEWFASPESYPFDGLLMNINLFRVMEQSGTENQSVQLYEYDAYRLKKFAQWPTQEMK
jgi:LysM repeat protein